MGGQPRPCGRPLGGGRNGPQPRPHTLTLARCDNVTASACPAGPRGGSPRSCREIRATPALCSGRLDCSPELERCWCGLPSSPGGAHQGPGPVVEPPQHLPSHRPLDRAVALLCLAVAPPSLPLCSALLLTWPPQCGSLAVCTVRPWDSLASSSRPLDVGSAESGWW